MSTPDNIVAAARAAFGADLDPAQIQPLAGGMSGAKLFTIAHGGREYVARQSAADHGRATPAGEPRDVACMRIASDTGVGPRVVYASADGVAIMEKLVGAPIHRETDRAGGALFAELARVMRALHAGPAFPSARPFGEILHMIDAGLARQPDPAAHLPAIVRETVARLSPATARFADRAPCHHDLNPSNFFLTAGGQIYIVDWEHASAGDPYEDVAHVGLWICANDAERAELFERYLGRAPDPLEQAHMAIARALALAFYTAAFYWVASLAKLVPPPAGQTLRELWADLAARSASAGALTVPPPHRMAAALVTELAGYLADPAVEAARGALMLG